MIRYPATYFDIGETLDCGQVFRFRPYKDGYLSFALDKCAYVHKSGDEVIVESDDDGFFQNYFDLSADYEKVVSSVLSCGREKVISACERHKGIRILRQSEYEAFLSFIISQNNNIPRIKSIIEKLCAHFGEKRSFGEVDYYAFPTVERLADADEKTLTGLGLGYRAEYIRKAVDGILSGAISFEKLSLLPADQLKTELLKIKGVGNKVADCTLLFGFHKTDAFPVDTWIEKLYHEDFDGTLTDRKKISQYFTDIFKENSGLVQQYLFHAKRNGEL